MNRIDIKIKKLQDSAQLPIYKSEGSAGADLRACIEEDMHLKPCVPTLIPTGLSLELPVGYEAQVRSRSGLALKGIVVLNSPGTIDSDYRGEVGVILFNTTKEDLVITNGDRIAQLIIAPVTQGNFIESQDLTKTERGAGGFGSTGIK